MSQVGKKYVIEMKKGVVAATEKGFKEYGKGFTTWGYTKEALGYWALLFREWLDRFHGKAPAGGGGTK